MHMVVCCQHLIICLPIADDGLPESVDWEASCAVNSPTSGAVNNPTGSGKMWQLFGTRGHRIDLGNSSDKV